MFKAIDHLVIVVRNLDQAAADYERLGFTVVPGGRHPVGSHNALISFADSSYLEIIAFYREAMAHRWWNPLAKGERFVDFCLQTDDLQSDTRKLRAAGVAIKDPVPWSRTRPDGYELKWLLSLATDTHRGIAPFLIQDITPREERVPAPPMHKNGVVAIDTVTVAVNDVSPVDRWYSAVLGRKGEPVTHEPLAAEGLRYKIGLHSFEFLMPLESGSPLVNWLRRYGPSPYAATLRTKSSSAISLDTNLTHGANFSLVN
jgi:catechol 2,3-dioxygenase-like lactoylglutathione lyase family enzyme